MRRSGNIFGTEHYRGAGIKTISKTVAVTFVLLAISILAGIFIIANFNELTARIVIWVANFLSSGFPILGTVVVIIYFVIKLKWKMRRRFWR